MSSFLWVVRCERMVEISSCMDSRRGTSGCSPCNLSSRSYSVQALTRSSSLTTGTAVPFTDFAIFNSRVQYHRVLLDLYHTSPVIMSKRNARNTEPYINASIKLPQNDSKC